MAGVKAPRWISHRGYCKHEIENTQGAFDEAVNLGFDRLETDLRFQMMVILYFLMMKTFLELADQTRMFTT